MPMTTLRGVADSNATGSVEPATLTACPSHSAASRFIGGVPMKPATSTDIGRAKISRGVPTWTMRPSMNTAMRSASVIASSWSWVT